MITVKSTTAKGKRLVEIGTHYEGTWLHQVYDSWSNAKQIAWDKCYDEYCNTDGAEQFGICSHNTFGFTVSWFTPHGMRLETKDNSYLVVFPD